MRLIYKIHIATYLVCWFILYSTIASDHAVYSSHFSILKLVASVRTVKCGKPKRNLCFPESHPLSNGSIQNFAMRHKLQRRRSDGVLRRSERKAQPLILDGHGHCFQLLIQSKVNGGLRMHNNVIVHYSTQQCKSLPKELAIIVIPQPSLIQFQSTFVIFGRVLKIVSPE